MRERDSEIFEVLGALAVGYILGQLTRRRHPVPSGKRAPVGAGHDIIVNVVGDDIQTLPPQPQLNRNAGTPVQVTWKLGAVTGQEFQFDPTKGVVVTNPDGTQPQFPWVTIQANARFFILEAPNAASQPDQDFLFIINLIENSQPFPPAGHAIKNGDF